MYWKAYLTEVGEVQVNYPFSFIEISPLKCVEKQLIFIASENDHSDSIKVGEEEYTSPERMTGSYDMKDIDVNQLREYLWAMIKICTTMIELSSLAHSMKQQSLSSSEIPSVDSIPQGSS